MRFAKGHGTENDFVVLPDLDDTLDLRAELVQRICDRRQGLGADGVLRVVRHDGIDADWFMDYRNADGSPAEMCGNGIRVYARWLYEEGLAEEPKPVRIATRGGVRVVEPTEDGLLRVDMGPVALPAGDISVTTEVGRWQASPAYAPNPHVVAFVDDLDAVGSLRTAPLIDPTGAFPEGVNVEFVTDRGPQHVAMRVHERGSGETRSCGTGVCAVAAVAAHRAGETGSSSWTVDVPGGRLTVDLAADNSATLTGPALIVARGDLDL